MIIHVAKAIKFSAIIKNLKKRLTLKVNDVKLEESLLQGEQNEP